jgi:hypothetical protein
MIANLPVFITSTQKGIESLVNLSIASGTRYTTIKTVIAPAKTLSSQQQNFISTNC